jgi:hypothetical protein
MKSVHNHLFIYLFIYLFTHLVSRITKSAGLVLEWVSAMLSGWQTKFQNLK